MNKIRDHIEGVSDSEMRIDIWDIVPGNNDGLKLDKMNVDLECDPTIYAQQHGANIVGAEFSDNELGLDSYTYHFVIRRGYASETFTDQPYIIPYVIDGKRPSIIVIPGGAFSNVTSDGSDYEGKTIAKDLNAAGFSAFVLHYRINPYEFPYPILDVQRAVRFIRKNADELGVDGEKIGLIGFSAGGFEAGGFINLLRGKKLFPEDYTPDETDAVNDNVYAAGLIYPVADFRFNVPMLFNCFDSNDVRDPEKREMLLDLTDLKLHFRSSDVAQFVSFGKGDNIVGPSGGRDYALKAKEAGTDVEIQQVNVDYHGYDRSNYLPDFIKWLKDRS